MVFIACVLVTLSTLAVHGEIVSTDGPVIPRGCEGNTFCNIKPADYPQEDIDSFLESNPAYLKRLKWEANRAIWSKECNATDTLDLEDASEGGNCRTIITCEQPFAKLSYDSIPHHSIIVQSKFFQQTIRQVRCSVPTSTCFYDYTHAYNAACKQISLSTHISVWDRKQNAVVQLPSVIDIDCVCEYI